MASEQGVYLRELSIEIYVIDPSLPVPFFCDNNTLVINSNKLPEDCNRVHISTKFFEFAAYHRDGTFRVLHIPGDINPADVHTKVLPVGDYARYRDLHLFSRLYSSATGKWLRTVIDLATGKVLEPC